MSILGRSPSKVPVTPRARFLGIDLGAFLSWPLLPLIGAPTLPRHPASKSYLDALWVKGTDILSATTLAIPATGGGYFFVTGTTTITGLTTGLPNGRRICLKFNGILTLTHNVTSLILPGAASITTAAGDIAELVCDDGTNWRCVFYQRASGLGVAAPATIQSMIEKTPVTPYTFVAADKGTHFVLKSSGSNSDYTLDVISNLGAGWWIDISLDFTWTDGSSGQPGAAVIRANAANNFLVGKDGVGNSMTTTALTVGDGSNFRIYTDGTNFFIKGRPVYTVICGNPTAALGSTFNCGFRMKSYQWIFNCTSTDLGYAAGDSFAAPGSMWSNTINTGYTVYESANNGGACGFKLGSALAFLPAKTTGTPAVLTATKWTLMLRVFG